MVKQNFYIHVIEITAMYEGSFTNYSSAHWWRQTRLKQAQQIIHSHMKQYWPVDISMKCNPSDERTTSKATQKYAKLIRFPCILMNIDTFRGTSYIPGFQELCSLCLDTLQESKIDRKVLDIVVLTHKTLVTVTYFTQI